MATMSFHSRFHCFVPQEYASAEKVLYGLDCGVHDLRLPARSFGLSLSRRLAVLSSCEVCYWTGACFGGHGGMRPS